MIVRDNEDYIARCLESVIDYVNEVVIVDTGSIDNTGKIIEETLTGPLFHIQPLETIAGKLQLLKIRKPDVTRPELGDADFTISNYAEFKKKYLSQKGFNLIIRKNFEMIELVDPQFNVRAYFSNPPLSKQFEIE